MNRDTFEALLDINPADWTTRLIYADWLEEQGDAAGARLQRWMVANKVCPERVIRSVYGFPTEEFWIWPRSLVLSFYPWSIPHGYVDRITAERDGAVRLRPC